MRYISGMCLLLRTNFSLRRNCNPTLLTSYDPALPAQRTCANGFMSPPHSSILEIVVHHSTVHNPYFALVGAPANRESRKIETRRLRGRCDLHEQRGNLAIS